MNRCSHAHSACKFPINVTVPEIKPHLALTWIKAVDAWSCGVLTHARPLGAPYVISP